MGRFVDRTGRRYGRLTVLRVSHNAGVQGYYWECQCDCGKVTVVHGGALTTGASRSCSCAKKHFRPGESHPQWRGGSSYPAAYVPSHASASRGVRVHVLVAERALGHPLPAGAHVHHVNGNKHDNRPANLVICQDSAYHHLLHLRARALAECGHADWRRCGHCHQWGPVGTVVISGDHAYHRECAARYQRERKARRALK